MELRHLRYFVVLAEELHFTRAAERLRMSQPPLSAQIKNLEQELGAALFLRDRRGVELTEAGRRFLPEARQTLDQAARAARIAREAATGLGGSLAIGVSPSVDLRLLPEVLRGFRGDFQAVELVLRNLYQSEMLQALRDGVLDVGFVRLPISEAEQRGLSLEKIHQEPTILALAADHPLAAEAEVPFAKLDGEACLLWHRHVAPAAYDHVLAACREAGFTPRLEFEADSLQTGLGLVAAGLAIAFVPDSARVLCREGVAYRPIAGGGPMLELGMVWRPRASCAALPEFLGRLRGVGKELSRAADGG
ncbi:MAG: LysR family transcriptional regulator [Sumerlaeia bacterium]